MFQTFRIRLRVQADTLPLLLYGQDALWLQRKLILSPVVVNCQLQIKSVKEGKKEMKTEKPFQDSPVKQQKSIPRHSHLLLTREGKHLQTLLQHMPIVVHSTLIQDTIPNKVL